MSHRTYPKEGKKKFNETIKKLKDQLKNKDKYIDFLEKELMNIQKPVRTRKQHHVPTHQEWKRDFIKRFNSEVLKKEKP